MSKATAEDVPDLIALCEKIRKPITEHLIEAGHNDGISVAIEALITHLAALIRSCPEDATTTILSYTIDRLIADVGSCDCEDCERSIQ